MSLTGKLAVISGENSTQFSYVENKYLRSKLGAGSGIGRAVCNILVRDGATIIAVDRNGATAAATIQSLGSCTFKNSVANKQLSKLNLLF